MNLGWVSQALPYVPSVGGFRLCGANLIRCLSQRHRIHLVSLLCDDDAAHLDWARQYCASVTVVPSVRANPIARLANIGSAFFRGQFLSGRKCLAAAVAQSMSAGHWEAMHVEGELAGGLLDPRISLPKLLSLHDSPTLRCREMVKCSQRLGEKLYYRWLGHHETRVARLLFPHYDAVTVVAEPDRAAVRDSVPGIDVRVISNGIDTLYFRPLDVAKQEASLVFHGHLAYGPNIEAARTFADDIFPRIRQQIPNATFHLVGADPAPSILELASRPGIRIFPNLEDIRPAVCAAQVYVCPIRYGTGLKNKVLEAMAMGLPVVGFPGARAGLNCTSGEHLLEVHSAVEFAQRTVELLRDPRRAEPLVAQASSFVEANFSWESRARAYEELYSELMLHHMSPRRHIVSDAAVAP